MRLLSSASLQEHSVPSCRPGSSGSPASQWAPCIAHGTTCSRPAEDRAAVAGVLASRKPSSARRVPHHVHAPLGSCGSALRGRFTAMRGRRHASSSSRGTRPARSCSSRRCGCSTPTSAALALELEHYDLSLENRRRTDNEVVLAAARAMRRGRLRHQGGDDHAGGRGRRRQPEHDPARGDRRQGDHPHRPADPGRAAGGGRAPPDLGRADGGRRRLRRRGAARSRGRRRGRVPHRAHPALRPAARSPSTRSAPPKRMHARVYGGPKWTVSPVYEGMLKEEIDAAAERSSRRSLQPAADRRHLRGAGRRRAADAPLVIPALNRDGDSPVGAGPAPVRLDRGRGVGAARRFDEDFRARGW